MCLAPGPEQGLEEVEVKQFETFFQKGLSQSLAFTNTSLLALSKIVPNIYIFIYAKCSLAAKGLHLPISGLLRFFSQRRFLFLHGFFPPILIKVFVSTAGNVNCAAGNLDIYFKREKKYLAKLLSSAMHRGTL